MIQEDYCSYEVSKLLKDKGFNESCNSFYILLDNGDYRYTMSDFPYKNSCKYNVPSFARPTHQRAMKWLREVHNILIVVSITYEKERYDWYICGIKGDPWEKKLFHEEKDVTYITYEEAVEAALKYCLTEIIQ